MSSVEEIYPSVIEMIDSVYPEQFGDGTLFWKLVESLVIRGSLDHAWHVLSKHSSYAQAVLRMQEEGEPEDPYLAGALNEIILEFQTLRDILLRAPLPGGRTEQFDDATTNVAMFEDIYDTNYIIEDMYGVNPSDYKYWEMDMNVGDELDSLALRKHQQWQDYVREQRHSFSLSRRMPQIDSILAILTGDFSNVEFTSWAEQFAAELLYLKPDLCPRSFSARAGRIIAKFDESSNPLLSAMLSIMDGNVGMAINLIWMMGGASGAALPSTIVRCVFYLCLRW
jgi:hypothetical protein